MARFKDWKEGESRVKAHVVTPTGASLDMYIPHLTEEQGAAAIIFLSCLMSDNPVVLSYTNRDDEDVEYSSKWGDRCGECDECEAGIKCREFPDKEETE